MEDNSIGVETISTILGQLKAHLSEDQEALQDFTKLTKIFDNKNFLSLIALHQSLKKNSNKFTPLCHNAFALVQDLHHLSQNHPNNDILTALSALFNTSNHLVAILSCHDKIADKTFDEPQISNILDDSLFLNDETGETIKVVRLVKGNEPLGATIATDDITGDIIIARILKGGAADRSGLIHVNDTLVEVNNVPTKGKKPIEVINLLAGFKGPLMLKLIPGESHEDAQENYIFLRALFTYLPQADNLVPCVEAGLSFCSGDILKVVSKDDISWWQATKIESAPSEKCTTGKVGLIPSLKLQTRREKLRRQAQFKASTSSIKGSNVSLISSGRRSTWNMIRASFRKKRTIEASSANKVYTKVDMPYYPPYELVQKYNPFQSLVTSSIIRKYRPIVLIGPQGVGRNDLKDRLIDSNPSHYGVPVPHTSRPHQPGEVDGKDYHFVSKSFMESEIRQGQFLEYGEYKGNFYGTSLKAVHDVINSGLVCVLTPYPQALSILRSKQFMSYIVFVRPPLITDAGKFDGLDDNINFSGKLTIERSGDGSMSDDDLRNLVSRAERMANIYGRLFDITIVNDKTDQAFSKLKNISFGLEHDEQWVPAEWLS